MGNNSGGEAREEERGTFVLSARQPSPAAMHSGSRWRNLAHSPSYPPLPPPPPPPRLLPSPLQMCAIPLRYDASDLALRGPVRQEVLPLPAAPGGRGGDGAPRRHAPPHPLNPPPPASISFPHPPLILAATALVATGASSSHCIHALDTLCLSAQIIGRDIKASAGMRVRLSNAGRQYMKIYDAKHGLVPTPRPPPTQDRDFILRVGSWPSVWPCAARRPCSTMFNKTVLQA